MTVDLPPGSREPGLLQIGRWIAQPLALLERSQRTYGDVFTFRAPGGAAFVIVADPALVKTVFAADPDVLLAGVGNATILEPMLGQHSLLTLDGAPHLRQRRLLLPAFTGERMQAFASVMRSITEASFAQWPLGRPFAIHTMMQSVTLDVILQTVFGVGANDHAGLRRDLVELLEIAANPRLLLLGLVRVDPLRVPFLRITRLKRAVDRALYQMIAERRRKPTATTDVLEMMLEARDDQGQPMTDVEIRDELVTLLLAGHETTATTLAWIFDQVLAHPPVLARLRTELAAGREDYLDAVIRETLRLRPILPLVGRHVAKPYQLGRWTLPPGTQVAPSIYLSSRNPTVYPDPSGSSPNAGSASSPTRPPGSRSGAASGAASGWRSRCSRCGSCCRPCSRAPSSGSPTVPPPSCAVGSPSRHRAGLAWCCHVVRSRPRPRAERQVSPARHHDVA